MKRADAGLRLAPLQILSAVAKARANRILLRPILPRLVTYCVTYRCNCRCSMCEMHKRAAGSGHELTSEEIGRIFSDRAFAHLEVVRFTGGEPLLRQDMARVIENIRQNTSARMFYITSNGSFPDRIEEFLQQVLPLDLKMHVQISFDDPSDLHDSIRGVPGLHQKVFSTLETLRRLREKWQFEVGINQTINLQTAPAMEEMDRIAREFKCAHNITLAVKFHEGRAPRRPGRDEPLPFETLDSMDSDTIENIYARIASLKNRHYRIRKHQVSSSLRNLLEGYLNEGGRNRLLYHKERPKPLCMALFTHFRLCPDGSVISCSMRRGRVVGTLRQEPFSRLWRSEAAVQERKAVKKCRGCWSECDLAPSIFYSGSIIPWGLKRLVAPPSGGV